jgi:hypothetical protein
VELLKRECVPDNDGGVGGTGEQERGRGVVEDGQCEERLDEIGVAG